VEPVGVSGISRDVKPANDVALPPRALRLKTEAGNCLTIAVGKTDPVFAGELIDEAMRLMRRAQELANAKTAARD
jgi:hypothetical protein